ncbi:HEPN domain-containing protein [filamentous cyanobacterium CCP5]|nr:HEPN domain-containing protein [filamentous cyanobacterium CCP5]
MKAAENMIQHPPFVTRHVCNFAQQSAEKALKPALILEQVDFPKSHDLDALRNLLPDNWQVKQQYPQLRELTNWIIESRYPLHGDHPTEEEAIDSASLAQGVWQSIYQDLLSRGCLIEHQ